MIRAILILFVFHSALESRAELVLGPWVPKFKGVEYSVSTNFPGAGAISTRRQVVHALRVDLHDPDIRFITTPRHTNYVENVREIGALTVSDFQRAHNVQAAINANFFSEGSYYLPAGYPMDLYGLAISEGVVVSPQDSTRSSAVMMFATNNAPAVIFTNWPASSTQGIYTAVAGNTPLVIAGVNVGRVRDVDPHTAFGLTEDRRYLILIALDGRQPGYSEGSNDFETAAWMLRLGAYDAINVDGGGSTTMVLQSSTGSSQRINKPSAVADSGRERTVGSHFGIYAKPLGGFINDVVVQAGEREATITFTTLAQSAPLVAYGTDTSFGELAGLSLSTLTNYTIRLSGLLPDTGYYFQVRAVANGQEHTTPTLFFKTTNYVTTNLVFGLDQNWRFARGQAPAGWTAATFDDLGWEGPGPGLLWVDTRATPNPEIQPRGTDMGGNPATGYPYVTYYLRTSVPLAAMMPGSSLHFSAWVDDGAVFYLNGTEIYRLRIPNGADAVTLAEGFPCSGDATCVDEFTIPVTALSEIISSNNVLAVEVHNYNSRSSDITFGLSLTRIDPVARAAELSIRRDGNLVSITWTSTGRLEWADSPAGPWYEVSEAGPGSATLIATESKRFYRVKN